MTFDKAFELLPECLVSTIDNPRTIEDLRAAALHELDMYNEQQDGCLSAREIQQVKRYLKQTRY